MWFQSCLSYLLQICWIVLAEKKTKEGINSVGGKSPITQQLNDQSIYLGSRDPLAEAVLRQATLSPSCYHFDFVQMERDGDTPPKGACWFPGWEAMILMLLLADPTNSVPLCRATASTRGRISPFSHFRHPQSFDCFLRSRILLHIPLDKSRTSLS